MIERLNAILLVLLIAAMPMLLVSCGEESEEAGGNGTGTTMLPRQTSKSGGAEVSVSPVNVDADAGTWKFQVSIDAAEGAELNEDIAEAAFLVDAEGNEIKPVRFEGDAPGGRHREGTLEFDAVSPRPQNVILKIRGIGGIGERSFSWTLSAS